MEQARARRHAPGFLLASQRGRVSRIVCRARPREISPARTQHRKERARKNQNREPRVNADKRVRKTKRRRNHGWTRMDTDGHRYKDQATETVVLRSVFK